MTMSADEAMARFRNGENTDEQCHAVEDELDRLKRFLARADDKARFLRAENTRLQSRVRELEEELVKWRKVGIG